MSIRLSLLIFNMSLVFNVMAQGYKPNDYLVAKCENPQFGASDFNQVGLTTENTQFMPRNWYEPKQFVQKRFTVNGTFDKELFYRFYSALTREWNRFCYNSYTENSKIEEDINYDSYNALAPRKQFNPDYKKTVIAGCTFWEKIPTTTNSYIYKFDYAIINNEKVTTVNAPNITATLISSTKATVTYQNETIVLVSKDSLKYEGRGKNGVIVVANKVKGVLSRITIGATVNNQIVMLIYKRIKMM